MMEGNHRTNKLVIIILSIVIILLLAIIIGMCIYLSTLTTTAMDSSTSTSPLQSTETTLSAENQGSSTSPVNENIVTVSNTEANYANTSTNTQQNILSQQVTLNGKTHTITINATTPEKVGVDGHTTTCTIQFDSKTIKTLEDFYCLEDPKSIVGDLKIMDNQYLVIPIVGYPDSSDYECFYFINDKGEILASINTHFGTSVVLKNSESEQGFQQDDDHNMYTLYKIEGNSFMWIQYSGSADNIVAAKYKLTLTPDSAIIYLEDTYDSSEVESAGKV